MFAGVVAVSLSTRMGAALSDDSYAYIKPARDILAGKVPYFAPHYPPLIPLILTGLGFVGIEPLAGIRVLNIACFAVNILLISLVIRQATGSNGFALLGGGLALSSQVMVEIHSWAMSEALFITWTLACVFTLSRYLASRRFGWLWASAILAGLSGLTRYAGLAVIAAGLATLFLASAPNWRTRLISCGLFGLVSGTLFYLYPFLYGGASQELVRVGGLRFEILTKEDTASAFYNILLWFMPGRIARGREIWVMAVLVLLIVAAGAVYVIARKTAFQSTIKWLGKTPVVWFSIFFLIFSLFVLYQAHLSPTYRSPFDSRLLAPTHAAFLLVAVLILAVLWMNNGRWTRNGIVIVMMTFLFLYASRSFEFITDMREHGLGFASSYWHDLEAASFIRSIPAEKILSTAPTGIYFATGVEVRYALFLTPDEVREFLRSTGGYLIVFNSMPLEISGYPAEQYLQGLVPIQEFQDCTVYQSAPISP